MIPCQDFQTLEALVAGSLPGDAARSVREHVHACSACRDLLAATASNVEAASAYRDALRDLRAREDDPVPETLGRYRILRPLGRGGMGRVYEAEDPVLRRRIAVKVLSRGPEGPASPSLLTRFEHEAQLLAALNHPNIATVYSLEDDRGLRFLTMELVDGESLADRLRSGPLALDEALAVIRQIALAMGAAHRRRIVHRDLKPANVVLTPEGRAKVLDFGLATMTGAAPAPEAAKRMEGTPGYMAPEQALGEGADPRSDVWALGCLLYECLSGRRPFPGPDVRARMAATLVGEPDWSALPVDLPEAVRAVIVRCLAKDPGQRPPDTTAVRQAVEDTITLRLLRLRSPAEDGDAGTGRRDNLPRPLSRFVGREALVRRARGEILTRPLVTLTGVGGCGKSRLAVETGRALAGEFPDGVWFVDLAPVSDPAGVARAVASALGLHDESGTGSRERLRRFLARRELLLILDNCEHLVDACRGFVDDALGAGEGRRVLATSREPLGLAGEAVVPVPPLQVPGPQAADPRELRGVESVRLFVDRARGAAGAFELTADNAAHVAGICRRVDGIPLALELAAAVTGAMPVEQVARLLEDRLPPFGANRSAAVRHQTLRASLDWSYVLLSRGERVLFRRLAVFRGGWSADAAEAVCAGDGIEDWEVLDLLIGLTRKSLLQPAEGQHPDDAPSYRMLQTVRDYAAERLREAEGERALRVRHAAHFLALAEAAVPELVAANQATWMRRLRAGNDDLRAALEFGLGGGSDPERVLRLAGALGRYWDINGAWTEGRRLLHRALELPGGDGPARTLALNWAGNLTAYQGDFERAKELHRRTLDMARRTGDRWHEASALNNLGAIAAVEKDYATAADYHARALAIRREIGSAWGTALSLYQLGTLASKQGDHAAARGRLEESLRRFLDLGDQLSAGKVHMRLGITAGDLGDPGAAGDHLREGYRRHRELDEPWGAAVCLLHLGALSRRAGEPRRARERFEECLQLSRRLGDDRIVADCLTHLARLDLEDGEWRRAARLWGAARGLREDDRSWSGTGPAEDAGLSDDLAAALGEESFARECAAGAGRTLDASIREAVRGEPGAG